MATVIKIESELIQLAISSNQRDQKEFVIYCKIPAYHIVTTYMILHIVIIKSDSGVYNVKEIKQYTT